MKKTLLALALVSTTSLAFATDSLDINSNESPNENLSVIENTDNSFVDLDSLATIETKRERIIKTKDALSNDIYNIVIDKTIDECVSDVISYHTKSFSDIKTFSFDDTLLDSITTLSIKQDGTLDVAFDDEKLKEFLKSLGGTVASFEGPVLVWMANIDNGNSTIINAENALDLNWKLQDLGNTYNIKYMYPLLDLEDLQNVNNDVIINDHKKLVKASQRYGVNYVLALVYDKSQQKLNYAFYNLKGDPLVMNDLSGSDDVLAKKLCDALMQGVILQAKKDNVGENVIYSAHLLGPGTGFVRLKINNINNLNDYYNLRNLLVTYGYNFDTKVVSFVNGAIYLEVPTEADPRILVESLKHSRSDFLMTGDYTFDYLKGSNLTAISSNQVVRLNEEDLKFFNTKSLKDNVSEEYLPLTDSQESKDSYDLDTKYFIKSSIN